MKPVHRLLPYSALALIFLAVGCGPQSDSESLTLNSFPSTIHVGDTTDVFTAVKKARDTQGRMQTNSSYNNFYLVSEDSTIARVYQNRRIIAVSAGHTSITAKDAGATLSSGKYALTVTP